MPLTFRAIVMSIRRWFPVHDPVAVAMARLAVLREDSWLEAMGYLTEEQIDVLDGNGLNYRRLYFLRNSLRTYSEIKSVLSQLRMIKDFINAIKACGADTEKEFVESLQFLDAKHDLLKEVRNSICGHVLERAVKAGLENIQPGTTAILALSGDPKEVRFGCASPICAAILFAVIPEEEIKTIFLDVHTHTFRIVNIAFYAFASSRGLM